MLCRTTRLALVGVDRGTSTRVRTTGWCGCPHQWCPIFPGSQQGLRPEPKAPASSLFTYLTASNRPKWVAYSSPITPNTGMPASL